MTFSLSNALQWTSVITGAAIFFQTLELLAIRKSIADTGVWSWQIVQRDFKPLPSPIRAVLERLLSYRAFLLILATRLVLGAAMAFTFNPVVIALVFASTLLIALRWRGSFNGGSDFMNLIVLSALSVASANPGNEKIQAGCLWYIAIQTCTSYFIAGLIKLRQSGWRNGSALSGFIKTTIYSPDPIAMAIGNQRALSALASWGVILFECTFPIALLNAQLCILMMGLAFAFHLANFYFFGLNRFVLSWAATYPALLFCSLYFQIPVIG